MRRFTGMGLSFLLLVGMLLPPSARTGAAIFGTAPGALLRAQVADPAARDAYFLEEIAGEVPGTDSAAAATALATGEKTDAGNVAWARGDPAGGALETLAERLRANEGYAIGAVSTVPFSHATPASFVSHHPDREAYHAIGHAVVMTTTPEVVIGGGYWPSTTRYISEADWEALVGGRTVYSYTGRQAGVDGGEALRAFAAGVDVRAGEKLFGLYGGSGGNFEFHGVADTPGAPAVTRGAVENPFLADAVEAALGVLNADPEGFFVLFEQGDIDWANHANDYAAMVGGIYDLDAAVRAAERFVEEGAGIGWEDTLLVVTADHANGYMRLHRPLGRGDLPEQVWDDRDNDGRVDDGEWTYPGGEVSYRTTEHTNELVTLWARGAGADLFDQYAGQWYAGTRIVDNTQIYHVLRRAAEERGVKHVILFVGDGMHVEHEIAGSRYLYGVDMGLAWHGWGQLSDGWAGYAATWDVTTYDAYASVAGRAPYDPAAFDARLGYDPARGGDAPYPLQPDTRPEVTLAPARFDVNLAPGEALTVSLVITNTGVDPLTWEIVEAPPAGWLSVEPISGTLETRHLSGPSTIYLPGSATVDVRFDATGLAMGTYTGLLVVENNSAQFEVLIPVTLRVGHFLYLPSIAR